jgi:D-lactate dehydrogenase (cytochrome)
MDGSTSAWTASDYSKESIKLCVNKIKDEFGQQFSNSKSILEQHTHTMTIHESELPDGVVFVETKEDVQKVVKICNEYKCPIIPFGVGSSFEGHINAPYGGISIDMNNMNKIINVYQEDLLVVVQPGVTREQLNTHLRDTGLFFPN